MFWGGGGNGRNRITFAIVAQVILVWTSCPNIAGNLSEHQETLISCTRKNRQKIFPPYATKGLGNSFCRTNRRGNRKRTGRKNQRRNVRKILHGDGRWGVLYNGMMEEEVQVII